jgi:class 3 adenylate cyclase
VHAAPLVHAAAVDRAAQLHSHVPVRVRLHSGSAIV